MTSSVPSDSSLVGSAREGMAELEKLFDQVRESLMAHRYVEAAGWLTGSEDILEGITGELGLLAAGQVIRTVAEP